MPYFIKKAFFDIRSNQILNLITIITIALTILVVSLFLLFFENVSRAIDSWNQGGRVMVYLSGDLTKDMQETFIKKFYKFKKVKKVTYITKEEALKNLKDKMSSGNDFFKTLKDNPLPNAFKIQMKPDVSFKKIQQFAEKIKQMQIVTDLEYGIGWLNKFLKIFNVFKVAGYGICFIFFAIALFITANTMRLAFYSRKLEVEIMRLVGATEMFIKAPFYFAGILQGFLGGILGIFILLFIYTITLSGITKEMIFNVYFNVEFISAQTTILIIFASTFSGWFGCYLSLKQIIK